MATRKKSTRKKSSGRKYGDAASKSVERAMKKRGKGTLRSGKGGKGGKVTSRRAGDSDRTFGGAQEGREGAGETEVSGLRKKPEIKMR